MKRQGLLHVAGEFEKLSDSPTWSLEFADGSKTKNARAWQSNGGETDAHPHKTCPYTLHIPVPEAPGRLREAVLIGVFAQYADREAPGIQGASIFLGDQKHFDTKVDLYNGRHYVDASAEFINPIPAGDGTALKTLGAANLAGQRLRLDALSIDVANAPSPKVMLFHDLNTPASFIVFETKFLFEVAKGCPFHAKGGGIPLRDLAAIIRVGDRVRLHAAIAQLERALSTTEDLDEARGEALTFVAVITAATLEMGGSRSMHRVQLEAARKLDSLKDRESIARETRLIIEDTVANLMPTEEGPNDPIIDRALNLIDRNYAKDLSDITIATELGLSTSHFRYLFRKATGLPFHKYVIGLRLERARQLLLQEDIPVSQVAEAVGFSGLPHFSRAFSSRFSVNPSSLRRARE